MNNATVEGRKSLFKLFRFLLWYAIAVTAVFYLLPIAAQMLEDWYEAMSSAVRLLSLLGFFAAVGVWQVMSIRKRMKSL